MSTDNIKNLMIIIFGVLILLGLCVTVDYADTITANNTTLNMPNGTIVVNESINQNVIIQHDGKLHNDKTIKSTKSKEQKKKKKYKTITMTGKPSCGCDYGYYWHTRTYINYCPNCHNYGCLGNKYKYGARFEQEISCFVCDSDFCVCCGKEKYSWSKVYLRRI